MERDLDLDRPGFSWKLFAVVMAAMILIGDMPKLVRAPYLSPDDLRAAANLIAAAGLWGYAWQRRVLPIRFWRIFTTLFCFMTVALIAYGIPALVVAVRLVSGSMAAAAGMAVALGCALAMAGFSCLALLRLSAMIGPHRRPFGIAVAPDGQLRLPLGDLLDA